MRGEERLRERIADWRAVTGAFAVALFLLHIAAVAGGAYISRHWYDRPLCQYAPASWLMGAGIAVVVLPFLVAGLAQMLNEPADKAVVLVWLCFTAIEVLGALTLFKWAPMWCADYDLWWIACTLFIVDGLAWMLICCSPAFVSSSGGYRIVFKDMQPTYYQAVPQA